MRLVPNRVNSTQEQVAQSAAALSDAMVQGEVALQLCPFERALAIWQWREGTHGGFLAAVVLWRMLARLVEQVFHDGEGRLLEDSRAVRILNKPASAISVQVADMVTAKDKHAFLILSQALRLGWIP